MGRCKKILVVEDNEDVRESIVDVLNAEGFAVETARNGQEALDKLKSMAQPTLIFLDLMMPVMNGWEFLDAIKSDPEMQEHRVVTISAVPATESIEDTSPLQTHGSISKPLSIEQIWDQVSKHCEVPALEAIA